MLKIKNFLGINNVLEPRQLQAGELTMASNVDIDLAGNVARRAGFAITSETVHKNLHQADGFLLATRGTGDLVNVDDDVVLYPALGHNRVWYADLPDGRTAFSNGLITGLVRATSRTAWGPPIPASAGTAQDVAGDLHPGDYRWAIAYRRTVDGVVGGLAYCAAPVTVAGGGIVLQTLPQIAGHTINVYLTSHSGGKRYYAGNTALSMFSFTGENKDLVAPARTEFLQPAPAGRCLAFWRGRALVAVDNVLYASKPDQPELFNMRQDYKHFTADITLVQPVDDGIYLGTEKQLLFLAGTTFDSLVSRQVVDGGVVLGSGVAADGQDIRLGKGRGQGPAMVCIADGVLTAGFGGGTVDALTSERYATTASEVWASFRKVGELPQYLASVIA